MKIVKIPDKDLKIPPNSAFAIETSPMMMKLHQNMIVVGKRGSGKSTIITNYLRMLKEENKMDRVFVISPTFDSNKALMEQLEIDEDDVYDPEEKDVIENIINEVNKERDEWLAYEEKLKHWKRLSSLIKSSIPIQKIDPYLLLEFGDENGMLKKPESKYGHRPICGLFVDDCISTPLFRSRKFMNFITRHRHIAAFKEGGALGVSVFIAIQNFTAQSGGCPRAVRNNATSLAVFRCKDEKELKQIYESVAGEIEYDKFMKAYEYAVKENHCCLLIDLHSKKEHPSMFRKNLDEFIVMDELTNKQ
jgi:energy-coupling factor transporter ATP-binding protein EcfA2